MELWESKKSKGTGKYKLRHEMLLGQTRGYTMDEIKSIIIEKSEVNLYCNMETIEVTMDMIYKDHLPIKGKLIPILTMKEINAPDKIPEAEYFWKGAFQDSQTGLIWFLQGFKKNPNFYFKTIKQPYVIVPNNEYMGYIRRPLVASIQFWNNLSEYNKG